MDTAPLIRDHVLPVGGQTTRRCQPRILHLSDGITYQLGVDRQRDTVSDGYYTSHTRSRTNCRWTANETLLAMDTTPLRQHHVLSVGGQTTRHCQSWILHLSDDITYELWVDRRRDTVSHGYCTPQTGSRTNWGRTDNETLSVMDTAPFRRDHVLPAGGQTTRHCQPWILHLSHEISYHLWVDRQRDTVSDGYCTSQTKSRTACRWTDDETLSAMDTAPLTRDHAHPVGGQPTRHCQRWILHLSHEITDSLWVDRRDTVSDGYCTSHTRSYQLWVDRRRDTCQRWILHLSDETTYELWVD